MELTIKKEKVVEAASKCTEAKKVLEVLFPEAFVEETIRGFKVGDIVRGTGGKPEGKLGIVLNPKSKLVEFFEDIGGHTGGNTGKAGHCWWCTFDPVLVFRPSLVCVMSKKEE